MLSNINLRIFLPPFLLLAFSVIVSLIDAASLVDALNQVRKWILGHFDWLFNWTVFVFFIMSFVLYISPFGRIKIGGSSAVPIFSKVRWLAIVICTTVATGILFWGSAEPLFHLHQPPSTSIEPFTTHSGVVAMSALYMHWTFSPYALYCIVALLFSLSFYNYGLPFRVSSMLRILHSNEALKWHHDVIDGICLFALVAGMSASLGAGVLTISGGLHDLFQYNQGPFLWGLITFFIVIAFVSSAASGLKKGIKWLSMINIGFFLIMILVIGALMLDSTALSIAGAGMVDYVKNFVPRSLGISNFDREWQQSWMSFYWANWMAWAPVTALFLGRIGIGYTVREFLRFNLLYPSLFGIVWMTIFGGIAISIDLNNGGILNDVMSKGGPQDVIFDMINTLPIGPIGAFIFLIVVYISYVTAADSNTSAMSGLSATGISVSNPEAPLPMKIIWGCMIAIMSWVMISFAGIEGIKILSVLGGFPVLFLCICIIFILIKLVLTSKDIISSRDGQ